MVHIVPSRTTYTAREIAELMFAEVYKHHGLPRAIISDRDVLFTSLFTPRPMARQNEPIGPLPRCYDAASDPISGIG